MTAFIRTSNELKKIVDNTPFAGKDEDWLHVIFLSEKPAQVPIEEINKVKDKAEKFSVVDKEIYLFCPNGYGRTKLSNAFFERKLRVNATTRNWKTVNALLSIAV